MTELTHHKKERVQKKPTPAQVFTRARNLGKGQIIGVKHMLRFILHHCPLDMEYEKKHLLNASTLLNDALYMWEEGTVLLKEKLKGGK